MGDVERKVGQKIAQLRKDARLTQAKLAEKLDVETETVSRWERGQNTASLKQLDALAAALSVELCEMFRFEERAASPRLPTPMDRSIESLTKVVRRNPPQFVDVVTAVARTMSSRWPVDRPRIPSRPKPPNPVANPDPSLPGKRQRRKAPTGED